MEPGTYTNPDNFLYRYLDINPKGRDRIITHNELYFASPKDFNDPFDCAPPIKFTDSTDEEFMLLHKSGYEDYKQCNTSDMGIDIEPEEVEESVLYELKNNRIEFLREQEGHFRKELKKMSEPLGVLCLSATPYDILMWSHYANKHRGIVLMFDRKGLVKSLDQCYKVDYKNNVIDVKVLIDNLSKWHIPLLTKKSDHWDYEEEWRIIKNLANRQDNDVNPRTFKFPGEILKGIICGSNMSKHDKSRIRMYRDFNQLTARIYEAKRDNHSYSVSIDFNKWI